MIFVEGDRRADKLYRRLQRTFQKVAIEGKYELGKVENFMLSRYMYTYA